MKRTRGKRAILCTLLLLAGLVATCVLWMRAQQRQYALNRALIAALVKGDNRRALALTNEGADPNTRYTPPSVPSLLELIKQWLHRSPPPVPDSPTALAIACGGYFDAAGFHAQQNYPDDAPLVQTMLRCGGEINPKRVRGGAYNQPSDMLNGTPLMWAVAMRRTKTVEVLLANGANVSATGNDGRTALQFAVESGLADGTVQQLLAHGADPNLADKYGKTALMLVTQQNRHYLAALLKQYGARDTGKRP